MTLNCSPTSAVLPETGKNAANAGIPAEVAAIPCPARFEKSCPGKTRVRIFALLQPCRPFRSCGGSRPRGGAGRLLEFKNGSAIAPSREIRRCAMAVGGTCLCAEALCTDPWMDANGLSVSVPATLPFQADFGYGVRTACARTRRPRRNTLACVIRWSA